MNGTNKRLFAIIGAVSIVVFSLGVLMALLLAHSDVNSIATVTGFVTPTITTLLVFGTAKEESEHEDDNEQHH